MSSASFTSLQTIKDILKYMLSNSNKRREWVSAVLLDYNRLHISLIPPTDNDLETPTSSGLETIISMIIRMLLASDQGKNSGANSNHLL